MKFKHIDIRGMDNAAALKLLCEELNALRSELVRELGKLDASAIVLDDGNVLSDEISKLRNGV